MAKFEPVKTEIPLFTLMRALGVPSDREILQRIFYDLKDPESQEILRDTIELLKPSVRQGQYILSRNDCLFWIGNKVKTMDNNPEMSREACILRAKWVLQNYLLPHIGVEEG